MNKDDYLTWRNQSQTQEFHQAVATEMENTIKGLAATAGENQLFDRYRKGVLDGLRLVFEWQPEHFTDDDEGDTDAVDSDGTQDSY